MDVGPFPNTLVANTVTIMSTNGGQSDVETSKTSLHFPWSQEEAEMIVEPQLIPETESE